MATNMVENSCINHKQNKAELYCTECYEALCVKCGTVKHRDHDLLDLDDKNTMKKAMERTFSNTKELHLHREKIQSVMNSLEADTFKLNVSKKQTAHEKIDVRVKQICDDVRQFGVQLKTCITDMSKVQQAKLDTVRTQIEKLSSDVELALDMSEQISSDASVIKVLNALKLSDDVLKKQSTVDLPKIPDISFPVFNTNDTNVISAEQIGQCTSDNKLNVNTTFDFIDLKDDKPIYSSHTKITEYLSWYLAARHKTSTSTLGLHVHLKLPEHIESCNTSYTVTLHSSVTDKTKTLRKENEEFVRGGIGWGWPSFIDWATFIDRTNGFIDGHDKFTVSATLVINNTKRKGDVT